MSLLRFKCEKCGNMIWKRKVVFSMNHGKIITCKKCGCQYETKRRFGLIMDFIVEFIFALLWACMFFLDIYILSSLVKMYKLDVNGWYLLLTAFIINMLLLPIIGLILTTVVIKNIDKRS